MRVLITGATGGLGIALVEKFIAEGFETIGIGRNLKAGEKVKELGAKFVAADLNNFDFAPILKNIDIVIHAAALSSPWGRYKDIYDINVDATQKLLKAAKENQVRAFIFVSSPSVYAREMDQIGLKESDELPKIFMNDYAKTKAMAEEIVKAQNSDNFKTIIIRPRAIIGPNDNVLLPRFLRLIDKGKFPLFNNGDALIEPSDVRDIANVIHLCAQKYEEIGGEIFNISGAQSMPLRNMIENIANAMKKDVKFINLNYEMVKPIIGMVGNICRILPNYPEPPLTKYSLCALSFSQTFDLAKARDKLNYIPQFNAFETAYEIAKNIRDNA